MRLLLTFIIFILGGFYTFGKENCCEQCCEYLGNCCKKGKGEVQEKGNKEEEKGEVQEEFYLKRLEQDVTEEIKKLVSPDWYNNKGKGASFILYEKINNIGNVGLNDNDVIKVTKDKNGFSIDKDFITEENNTKKWALFEIIYKEEKEEMEEGKKVYLYCSDIENLGNYRIFSNCQQHISISVIACDTSGVTDMSGMFSGCSSLTELDLSKFNTETVTNMSFMFFECSSLTKLYLNNFDTKNVTDMHFMFSGCSSLTELDLSNFNTEKVIYMGSMFYRCASLQTVTINKILSERIKQLLNELDFTEEAEKKENVITLKKNN